MTTPTPTSLNCPACGAPLEYSGVGAVIRCKYCGNVSVLPASLSGQAAAPADELEDIRRLAKSGALIDAIKKYRQVYGADLVEAKEAVEALQAGRMAAPAAPGLPSSEELTKVIEEVQHLLGEGRKIEAIKAYRETYDVSLARAKYAIEQIQAGQASHPEAGFETARSEAIAAAAPKQNKSLGWIVGLVIFLVVGGIAALLLSLPGGPFVHRYFASGKAAMLASSQGVAPDFAMTFYDPDADNRFVGLLNGETGKLTWKAAPLTGDGVPDSIMAGSNLVYVANGTDLLAYRRSDGTLAWQATMTDKLNYGESTLLATAVRVVTNNADQTIQAYNADNGSPVWSKRLSGYDRGLHLIGSSLMVIDYVNEDNTYGLIFLDLFSGEQRNVILPTCTYNDYENHINPDSGFVYDAVANALYLVYDSTYGCVQRIDLSTGQAVWSTAGEQNFNFAPEGFQSLLTDSTLYFSDDAGIMAVDKSTGAMKVLLSNSDYELLPLRLAGDKLIVRARRTRGTDKYELWAVSAASGEFQWKIDLQTAEPIDSPNEMVGLVDKTGWGWTWRLTQAGLTVIQFQGQPNQVTLRTYSLTDGTSLDSQTLPLKSISGDFYDIPAVLGDQGNLLYLNIDQGIYSLDLAAAKLKQIH